MTVGARACSNNLFLHLPLIVAVMLIYIIQLHVTPSSLVIIDYMYVSNLNPMYSIFSDQIRYDKQEVIIIII